MCWEWNFMWLYTLWSCAESNRHSPLHELHWGVSFQNEHGTLKALCPVMLHWDVKLAVVMFNPKPGNCPNAVSDSKAVTEWMWLCLFTYENINKPFTLWCLLCARWVIAPVTLEVLNKLQLVRLNTCVYFFLLFSRYCLSEQTRWSARWKLYWMIHQMLHCCRRAIGTNLRTLMLHII